MRKVQDFLILELFWIPIILGGLGAIGLLSYFGGGETVLGYGSLIDNIIAIVLVIMGVWILIKMPGVFWRFAIGLSLLGFGLYIIIKGMEIII